jgi:hypothetical protein
MNNFQGIRKSKDDAVWQYLIDHSKPSANARFISFYIKGRGDWDSRIKSRMDGKYRIDERTLQEQEDKFMQDYYTSQYLSKKRAKQFQKFFDRKTLYTRLVCAIYSRCKKIIFK